MIEEITRELWMKYVGQEPVDDDLERANCNVGRVRGHMNCGWCHVCNKPIWHGCGHQRLPVFTQSLPWETKENV